MVREAPHDGSGPDVFEWPAYRVDGGKVMLLGGVHADLKRDAKNALKKRGRDKP